MAPITSVVLLFIAVFYYFYYYLKLMYFINPRRACASVTILYSVCVSVCLCVCVFSLFWHLTQLGVQTAVSATSARYGHEIIL